MPPTHCLYGTTSIAALYPIQGQIVCLAKVVLVVDVPAES